MMLQQKLQKISLLSLGKIDTFNKFKKEWFSDLLLKIVIYKNCEKWSKDT